MKNRPFKSKYQQVFYCNSSVFLIPFEFELQRFFMFFIYWFYIVPMEARRYAGTNEKKCQCSFRDDSQSYWIFQNSRSIQSTEQCKTNKWKSCFYVFLKGGAFCNAENWLQKNLLRPAILGHLNHCSSTQNKNVVSI